MPYFVGVLPASATHTHSERERQQLPTTTATTTVAGGDNKQLLSKCHSFKYVAKGPRIADSLPRLLHFAIVDSYYTIRFHLSLFAVPAVDSSTSSSSSASSAIVTVSVTPSSLSASSSSSSTETLPEQQQPQGEHPYRPIRDALPLNQSHSKCAFQLFIQGNACSTASGCPKRRRTARSRQAAAPSSARDTVVPIINAVSAVMQMASGVASFRILFLSFFIATFRFAASVDCEKDGKTYANGYKLVDPDTPCRVCYCKGK